MSLDSHYGEELVETTEASLAILLPSLSTTEKQKLMTHLVDSVPDLHLQTLLLNRLPIYPPDNATFRQKLAKAFLGLPPSADSSALLECLNSSFPFNEVKRDLSNQHARKILYAINIFDVAISQPPQEDAAVTRKIIQALQSMHSRIIDGRAAFLERTETKEVILRCYMRLDQSLHSNINRRVSLDKFVGIYS